jgi:hypothetical protein
MNQMITAKKRKTSKARSSSQREKTDARLRSKLKPAGHTPSGLPYYDYDDMKKLDLAFPKKK